MKNNRGQVLAMFVLLLPILLLLAGLVIDTGLAYMEKRKIEHVMKDTIAYGLGHLDTEESILKLNMTNLLKENISDIYEIKIDIGNQVIKMQVEKKVKTIFSAITTPNQTIKLSYKGNLIGEEIRIVKE